MIVTPEFGITPTERNPPLPESFFLFLLCVWLAGWLPLRSFSPLFPGSSTGAIPLSSGSWLALPALLKPCVRVSASLLPCHVFLSVHIVH